VGIGLESSLIGRIYRIQGQFAEIHEMSSAAFSAPGTGTWNNASALQVRQSIRLRKTMERTNPGQIEASKPWKVRMAGANDLDDLARFSALTALESEGNTLDRAQVRSALANVIDAPPIGAMFIARTDQEAIGSLLLNGREFSEWRGGHFYIITGVYVLQEFRRRGVRFDLFRTAWEWAREQPGALGFRANIHEKTNLENMMGSATRAHHNRPGLGVKAMELTPYRVIEVKF
jgi:GNAT superfamily N-acetyltransferase